MLQAAQQHKENEASLQESFALEKQQIEQKAAEDLQREIAVCEEEIRKRLLAEQVYLCVVVIELLML